MQVDDLTDAVRVRRWARVGGKLVGEAPSTELSAANEATSDAVEATLEEALALPWVSAAAREPHLQAFLSVLRRIETALEAARTRQRALDLDERLAGPSEQGRVGSRPFARDGRDP